MARAQKPSVGVRDKIKDVCRGKIIRGLQGHELCSTAVRRKPTEGFTKSVISSDPYF